MKKGLHVIRLLWRDTAYDFSPTDVPYGCPPKWSSREKSQRISIHAETEEEIAARKFATFHEQFLKIMSICYSLHHGREEL
jgi:hypothetical protein